MNFRQRKESSWDNRKRADLLLITYLTSVKPEMTMTRSVGIIKNMKVSFDEDRVDDHIIAREFQKLVATSAAVFVN
ncbi:DUF496 family protein [Vibrio lentus]|nr:DUF496 family protein [Vibrio lentus]